MAGKCIVSQMKSQRHIAMLALDRLAAILTNQQGMIASPIEEKNRLFSRRSPSLDAI
jgi:hypothetical protein